jgi:carboxypeptidase T
MTGSLTLARRHACAIVTTLGLFSLAVAAPASGSAASADKVSTVAVELADSLDRERLLGLGVDVMYLQDDSAEVLAHGARDVAALRRAGFAPRVLVEDVEAENRRARRAEERKAERLEESPSLASPLPTGRVSYRTMDETNAELRELARRYPEHVTLFALRHRTLLGQRVFGIHLSRDGTTDSGRPIFLNTGVNHAREWPTVEFTMEFAWDVLQSYGTDARMTALLDRADMIVVPMVGPDAYDISRRLVHEMKRKNCRMVPGEIPTRAQCEAPENEFRGVDLNRNYGAFWGGPGSNSTSETNMYYQGTGPFSEPETQNMRDLLASNQVTVAFNNHTPDRRLLRVPSAVNEPVPADEQMYDELARRIGAVLNWPATPWTMGYSPASGTAEQSWYYAAGTFAFTPEATPGPHPGLFRYHPPYEYVIDQYFGTANAPGCVPGRTCYDGSSMREAFLLALEAAGDPERHSVITGTAKPGGAELTIEKDVSLHTSPVPSPPERMVDLTLRSTMTVPKSGRFTWHVNPSRRPSQLASAHLPESWTLSCERGAPGSSAKRVEVQVTVDRGETADVDLRGCSRR